MPKKSGKRILPVLITVLLFIPVSVATVSGQGITSYDVYGTIMDENGNEIEAHITFEHDDDQLEIDADGSYSTDIYGLGIEYGDTVTVTATAYDLICEESFEVKEGTSEKELDLVLTSDDTDLPEIPPVNEFNEPAFPSSEIPGFQDRYGDELELDDDVYRYLRPESMLQPEKVERISRESAPLPNLRCEISYYGIIVKGATVDIDITLLNVGKVSVDDNVSVELSIDGQSEDIKTVFMDEEQLSLTFEWCTDTGGVHELKAVSDPEDDIVETDEKDNSASVEVMVYTASGLIDEVKGLLDAFKDDVVQRVERPQAIKTLIENVKRDLDRAENANKDWQKIHNINKAVDKEVLIVSMLGQKRDRGDVLEENATYLIGELGGIIDKTVWISYAFLPNDEMKKLFTAEAETVKALITGERYCYEEEWWDKCKVKLVVALEKYKIAVFKEGKGCSYQHQIDLASKFLHLANEQIPEDRCCEYSDEIKEHVVNAIMVFPPNMSVSPFDIEIEGDFKVDSRNKITFTVHNTGEVKIWNTGVELYARTGETEKVLKSYNLWNIRKDGSKSRSFWWTPESEGIYYIGVSIDSENHLIESDRWDNTAETGISILGHSTIWWNETHIVDGFEEYSDDKVILRNQSDLVIKTGGSLIFHNISFEIWSEIDEPALSIDLNEGGSFTMDEGSFVTAQQRRYPYKFHADGSLDITDSTVQWMWGDDVGGSSQPGGIQISSTG
ncbi:MAG: CARDB domain-containing protein, partial [Thermoplasmata archaeon]